MRIISTGTRNRDKEKKRILTFSSCFFYMPHFDITRPKKPTKLHWVLLQFYTIINTSSPKNIRATLAETFHPKTQRTFSAFWYSMATPGQSLPKLKTLLSLGNVLARHDQPCEPCKIYETECLQMLVVQC